MLIEKRFWAMVLVGDECWEWQGALSKGYGRLKVNGKHILAHRISWTIHNGEIPETMNVLHGCNNRKCVNPQHLYLGTQKENVRDAINAGTHHIFTPAEIRNCNRPRGTKVVSAKLRESDVREIRKLRSKGNSYRGIAKIFGVDHSTIISLLKGETWAHVS